MIKSNSDHIKKLWENYSITKDISYRNDLIIHYSYIVKHVINKLGSNYLNYYDLDDIISFGTLGLIDAVEKFNPIKGVKFETYARLRIKGSIIDQIRKQDWAPRSIRQKAKKITDTAQILENRFGRPPSDEEISSELGMPVDHIHKITNEVRIFSLISFDDKIIDTITSTSQLNNNIEQPDHVAEMNEAKKILMSAIDNLNDKEKQIISLYYFDEMNLKEIGMVLGISESRVSQLHTRSLIKLKDKLWDIKNSIL